MREVIAHEQKAFCPTCWTVLGEATPDPYSVTTRNEAHGGPLNQEYPTLKDRLEQGPPWFALVPGYRLTAENVWTYRYRRTLGYALKEAHLMPSIIICRNRQCGERLRWAL